MWCKEKVLQIGAFGLLANEAHASVLTAPLLEARPHMTLSTRSSCAISPKTMRFSTRMRTPSLARATVQGGAGVVAAHDDDGGAGMLDSAICERELAVVKCLRLLYKCQIEPADRALCSNLQARDPAHQVAACAARTRGEEPRAAHGVHEPDREAQRRSSTGTLATTAITLPLNALECP
jgi:hypothetical protein